jgi:hypothetical protein
MPVSLDQMLRDLEAQHQAAERRRDHHHRLARSILQRARNEGRPDVTPAEFTEIDRLAGERDRAARELAAIAPRLAEVRAAHRDDLAWLNRASETHPTGVARPYSAGTASLSVIRNERTYNPDRDREVKGKPGSAFLLDVGRGFLGDPLANERLTRHQHEELAERPGLAYRSVPSGNFTGFVVPQYLVDLYAPAVAAMRPFADICNQHDLPEQGMTVNLGRITTPTSVGLQATENTSVATQDIDDTLMTENVQTAAGSVQVSRQAIERGVLTEEVTTNDLMRRYATTLDSTLINQATTGLAAISTSQSYVNATVDTTAIPAFWKQLIQAQNTVEGVLLAQAQPSHFIMSPRRWNWATAAVSSSWPVVAGTSVPPQSWAVSLTKEYGPKVRAQLPNGMLITVDANISTACLGTAITGGTQDQVYAVAAEECHLWTDPDAPVMVRAEQPAAASLGILYVAYGYFAYSFRRYPGASVNVNGTGLATPSFV